MIIAPVLLYSDNDFDELVIADGLKIRKITEEELLKLFGVKVWFENQLPKNKKTKHGFNLWRNFFSGPLSRIINIFSAPYYLIESKNYEILDDLLFCIRIINPWNIFCPIGIEITNNNKVSSCYFYPNSITDLKKHQKDNRILSCNDIERLITFFETIRNNPPGNIKIIKRRLITIVNKSIDKNFRYAEAVGLMESIVSSNDQGELSFKFSLYSSYILSKYGNNTSFKEMYQAYTDRSSILHTGKAKKEITDQRLEKIIEYCQKIIYSSVVESCTSKKVKEMLLNELGI